ncbi:3-dehydroquinate dehydratase (3-dehydroquinase) [Mortierella sp. NVP85]|nr:3-dehydroquinate dehydratase (3-dehydroquinase) [Mortierella sp. NVP85]
MSHPNPHIDKVSILGEESICLGFHIFDYLVRDTLSNFKASTYVIVTDTHLEKLYLNRFKESFHKISKELAGTAALPRLLAYVIPPGENSKSREIKGHIEDYFLEQGCTRDTLVFAMGGGVIGDLVGFVAATFMRGIPFVQVPTTLLAMVDSSIGGKTAVDTPQAKNSIGAFWQPKRIFIDLSVLETLPEREFVNGMAEVIKTAAIWNESDFILLENGAEAIRDAVLKPVRNVEFQGATLETRTPAQQLLLKVVMASAAVKAYVVTHDERETGMRGLLNFGHSIGHAIEGLVTPKLLHGECVAAYGLPVTMEDKLVKSHIGNQYCSVDEIMRVLRVDKKNIGSQKRIVMLSAIGKTLEMKPSNIADNIIRKVLAASTVVHPRPVNAPPVTMSPPGSKSISNRVLVLAALGRGTCRLKGLLHSDDTQVMLTALTKLGAATFEWEDNGDTLVVHGNGGKMHVPDSELYLGNAGTAARFVTTVSVLVPPSSTPAQKTILTGNARMKQRPIAPLVDALTANGSEIKYVESAGCLPLEVTPFSHGLTGGEIQLAASISSQYVSSILLCAPYATKEPVTLVLTGGQVISQLYIDMTIAMMKSFGVTVEVLPNNTYRIPQGAYTNPAEYLVEADASSATYPLAIAAITGTTCTVPNIGSASLQGDAGFAVNVLRPMGCTVVQTETSTTVTGPPVGTLRPLAHIDMETMTDAFLTASVLAAVTQPATPGGENVTKISGIANQRVKECNRIAAMMHELGKFGVTTSEFDDGIIIHGHDIASLTPPKEGVKCYDDHRVAMSFSVLANVVPGGTIIREKKCVEKTWPTWWDDLEGKLSGRASDIDLGPPSEHHDYEVKASSSSGKKGSTSGTKTDGTTGEGRGRANRAQVVPKPTFFLSLTFPDVSPALPHLSKLTLGADAIELRVDLLKTPENSGISFRDHVAQQVALLRRHSELPILYTVRSVSQGGQWPDNNIEGMVSLLKDGLEWGVEYLDIEIGLPRNQIDNLLARKGKSLIVASWHDCRGDVAWSSEAMEQQYKLAHSISPDVIKLIGTAKSMKDNFECSDFATRHTSKADDLPLIAMNMGAQGQLSRVLNNYLTPVTHSLLPVKAAPGQLSARDILTARHIAGLLPTKQFYLFGTPISQSLSPLMHNTSFQSLGLPYHYSLHETATVDESVVAKMRAPDFGGASVTIPHKLDIMSKLDEITEEAKAIGAVNTVVPVTDDQGQTTLVGDNTDWLGIKYQIERHLSSTTTGHPHKMKGLVIGAGGTSRAALYALHRLGVREISIFNRTMVKAQAVADSFKDLFGVQVLSANDLLKSESGRDFDIVVSTIPGTIDSSSMFDESIFGVSKRKGVAVELAYTPRFTRFLKLASQAEWATVEGGQVLVEQGGWQAEKWVGRRWDLESVQAQVDLVQAGRQ